MRLIVVVLYLSIIPAIVAKIGVQHESVGLVEDRIRPIQFKSPGTKKGQSGSESSPTHQRNDLVDNNHGGLQTSGFLRTGSRTIKPLQKHRKLHFHHEVREPGLKTLSRREHQDHCGLKRRILPEVGRIPMAMAHLHQLRLLRQSLSTEFL